MSADRIPSLDLFSGIGGMALALARYAKPVAYCEIDPYCRAVLTERMADTRLDEAPIFDDVRTLRLEHLREKPEIITGGFPCQDISVAGRGAGLEGERSGLFFEIVRLAKEIKPTFLFLENVPAIRTRGLDVVIRELSHAGYDCRWGSLSAQEVGAPHKRERWFLLAHANGLKLRNVCRRCGGPNRESACEPRHDGANGALANASISRCHPESAHFGGSGERSRAQGLTARSHFSRSLGNSNGPRLEVGQGERSDARKECAAPFRTDWWSVEPDVGRVVARLSSWLDGIGITERDLNAHESCLSKARTEGVPHPSAVREMWIYNQRSKASQGSSGCDLCGIPLCEMPREGRYGPWYVGTWTEESEGVRCVRKGIYPPPFKETLDLQRGVLERTWTPECVQTMAHRVNRIKGLGNAVVPAQAREAFERLAGLTRCV